MDLWWGKIMQLPVVAEELLELFDQSGVKVVGVMPRSMVYAFGLKNYRVVNGFIRHPISRKLWIPRRMHTKKLFPGCLDMSVGGHVSFGESDAEAFIRESIEEINFFPDALHNTSWRGCLSPYIHDVSSFMTVYEIFSSRDPEYNHQDFCESMWLSPQEILDRIEQGDPHKPDLPKLIRRFFL